MPSSSNDKQSSTSQWNETLLNYVDKAVDTATVKVVSPAHKFARFFVYTLVALALLTVVMIASSIALFRLLNLAMPVWASYMIIGAIFVLIGSVFWAKK